jgi:hypothetical protein
MTTQTWPMRPSGDPQFDMPALDNRIPPDDGQHMPETCRGDWRNKYRENSESSWFLLYGQIYYRCKRCNNNWTCRSLGALHCTVYDRPSTNHPRTQRCFTVMWMRIRWEPLLPAIDSTCSPLTVNLTSHSARNKFYSLHTSFRLSKHPWHETFPMWPVSKSFWRHHFLRWFISYSASL